MVCELSGSRGRRPSALSQGTKMSVDQGTFPYLSRVHFCPLLGQFTHQPRYVFISYKKKKSKKINI